MTEPLPPLAVTMGDPAGIGPDIALLAFATRSAKSLPPFFVIGSARVFTERAAHMRLDASIQRVKSASELSEASRDALNILDMGDIGPVVPGRTDTAHARCVLAAIEMAVELVSSGLAAGIVTNPVAKSTLTAAGFKHPGHTEFLGELASNRNNGKPYIPVMMMASEMLRVVPLTVHIPLARVPSALTCDLIVERVRIVIADLRRYFAVDTPRIAVAGLNPHAGESGTLGREEVEIIAPAIAALRAEGHDVSGPHSADTMFHAAARKSYDAAIAMYHDQALIPLKTLAFDSGVNITLGLPFVRTSPDHGTAFDIAGTGRANPSSFIAALEYASTMARATGSTR